MKALKFILYFLSEMGKEIGISDIKHLEVLFAKERHKADMAFGLSDDQCAHLIDLYLLNNEDPDVLAHLTPLHVCVNRPP